MSKQPYLTPKLKELKKPGETTYHLIDLIDARDQLNSLMELVLALFNRVTLEVKGLRSVVDEATAKVQDLHSQVLAPEALNSQLQLQRLAEQAADLGVESSLSGEKAPETSSCEHDWEDHGYVNDKLLEICKNCGINR